MAIFSIDAVVPEIPPIRIVDVGAMMVPGRPNPYDPLLASLACEVVGFEPVAAECERLNAHYAGRFTFLPHVIGDGTEQTFYQCEAAYNSSLLEPNRELLERFTGFGELFRVVATSRVATRRLDDLPEAAGADYLKLDVQGGELMVLRGAIRILQEALVVHTEAEFLPIYRDQPLFADIDAFLRAHGFVLHRIPEIGARLFDPFVSTEVTAARQMLWCDAIYVRDFLALDRLSADQLLKLAAILHENYDVLDLAAMVLGAHDRRTGSDFRNRYVGRLAAP